MADRYIEILKNTFLDYKQTKEVVENPLIFEKAERLYYWDTEGKRYFDGIGGIFVAALGHRHPRVMEAVRRQMETITFAPPLHGISRVTLDYIRALGEVTPGNLNFIKPFSGGSESVESALKFVRQYFKQTGKPGKYKVISRYSGYHGATFGAMAASGTGPRKTPFEPQMGGFLKVPPPTWYRDRFSSWEECNRFSARLFEDIIVNEDPHTVAAVILEPIGNTGGIITPTEEYYRIIREICDKYDVLLIFDEIITGFGRTGSMFAAQTYGVIPDIICSGKGAAGGAVTLGAMIARQDLADAFWGEPEENVQFAHGHTFAGHPLGCAAGLAVISAINEENLLERCRVLGSRLSRGLKKLEEYGVVREVRGKGLLQGVELCRDGKPFPALGKALKKTALKNGLIMRIDPNWFALAPALTARDQDVDELLDLVEKSLSDAINMAG
ncbi:MAG: aspartate aminotransferase family protein [Spirochaetia bacterium]